MSGSRTYWGRWGTSSCPWPIGEDAADFLKDTRARASCVSTRSARAFRRCSTPALRVAHGPGPMAPGAAPSETAATGREKVRAFTRARQQHLRRRGEIGPAHDPQLVAHRLGYRAANIDRVGHAARRVAERLHQRDACFASHHRIAHENVVGGGRLARPRPGSRAQPLITSILSAPCASRSRMKSGISSRQGAHPRPEIDDERRPRKRSMTPAVCCRGWSSRGREQGRGVDVFGSVDGRRQKAEAKDRGD